MNTEIEKLKEWLVKHKSEIPLKQDSGKTLMDYIGCRTLENPWSDLYSFFLDNRGEHKLGNLFIDSLGELLNYPANWLKDYDIYREYPVEGDKRNNIKRIDILLTDSQQKHAIIIENKVHHSLENRLDLYTNAILNLGYDYNSIKKLVIVVQEKSWEKEKAEKNGYEYITHQKYVNTIIEKLQYPIYSSQADSFYKRVLENFVQNILNVTNDMKTNDEQIRFFIDYFENSKQVYGIYKSTISDYKKQLNNISFDMDIENPKIVFDEDFQLIYLPYKSNNTVLLTILLNYMWAKSEWYFGKPFIRVALELKGKAKDSFESIDNTRKEKLKDDYRDFVTSFSNLKDNHMMHFAYLDIPINEERNIMPEGYVDFIKKHLTKQSGLYKLGMEIIELIK